MNDEHDVELLHHSALTAYQTFCEEVLEKEVCRACAASKLLDLVLLNLLADTGMDDKRLIIYLAEKCNDLFEAISEDDFAFREVGDEPTRKLH